MTELRPHEILDQLDPILEGANMTERLDPEEVVAALRAAETDEDRIEIERRYVTDTAEEDPGEVEDDGHRGPNGERRRQGRG